MSLTAANELTAPTSEPPLAASSEAAVCDLAQLLDRCMGDASFAELLLDKYTATLAKRLDQIDQAILASDLTSAVSQVHALKGESGNMAALRLQQAAYALEMALRHGPVSRLDTSLAALKFEAACFLCAAPDLCDSLRILAPGSKTIV